MKDIIELRIKRISNGYLLDQTNSTIISECYFKTKDDVLYEISKIMKHQMGSF